MVSKPWQNYFDDVQQPKAPIDVLENNPQQINVSLCTRVYVLVIFLIYSKFVTPVLF